MHQDISGLQPTLLLVHEKQLNKHALQQTSERGNPRRPRIG